MFCREILIAVDVQDYPTSRPWSPAELSTVDSLEAQVPDQQGKCSKDALLLLICHRKQDACEWQRVAFPRKERRQQKLLPNQCFNPPTKEKKNKFCTIRQTSSALSSDVLRIGLKEKIRTCENLQASQVQRDNMVARRQKAHVSVTSYLQTCISSMIKAQHVGMSTWQHISLMTCQHDVMPAR